MKRKTKKVTVEQLILSLKAYSPKMGVVVRGYEGGYQDVSYNENEDFEFVRIKRDVNTKWYLGPHDDSPRGQEYIVL